MFPSLCESSTCILNPLPHLLLLLLSFPLALFYIYPPLCYTFITRSVLFLLHHIATSLASTFPFFSSCKSNFTPQLPLSSLQYCGKGKKIYRFKQTNQSSGNSLFVPEIKITGWWMNTLTLSFPLNEPLSLRLWDGSTYWSGMFAASAQISLCFCV